MVVEIVDEAEKIESFIDTILPYFENINKGCMITVEKANIILHKKGAVKTLQNG
jgi:PII-like signaling protein